jgi:ABC-type uncharacterized transport system permease subunit
MADPKRPYIEMVFAFDEVSQNFERRVQTLAFAMSIIGGLLGLVTSIIHTAMGWIQEQKFHSSVMEKIFFQ